MAELYTFNKRSNHVLFFKWLWGVDPIVRYKTMCPYFWSYAVTILILPFLVLIRLFGTWGQEFNGWLLTYKADQRVKKIAEFKLNVELCKNAEEAYKLTKTKCWSLFTYELGYTLRDKLEDLAYEHKKVLWEQERIEDDKEYELKKKKTELKKIRVEKTTAIKESKIFKVITYIFLGIISLFILYGVFRVLYILFVLISWSLVFTWIGYILLGLIGVGVVIGVCVFMIKYILKPMMDWLECRTFNFDCMLTRGIGHGFEYIGIAFRYIGMMFQYMWSHCIGPVGRGIGHGVVIFFDTIYNIYKKRCPLITWEE